MVELDPRLLALADEGKYRITSGVGGTHNPGSLHGSGLAIDIDHRNVDYEQLKQRVEAVGGRVLDERTRPKGQKVWGGPHFHIELPRQAAQKAIEVGQMAKQIEQPQIDPRNYSVSELLDLAITGQGFPTTKPVIKSVSVPTTNIKQPEIKQQVELDRMVQNLNSEVEQGWQERQAAQQARPEQPQYGLGTEIVAGLSQPLSGYTRDEAASALGDRPAYMASSILGNIGVTGLSALGFGGLPGAVGAQAAQGAAMELQRQRIQGEEFNPLKAGGSALIQGGTAAIAPLKGASLLGTIGKNVARDAAIGAGGSVAQQLVEGQGVNLGRTLAETGLAGAGGAVAGYMARPPRPLAPRPAIRGPQAQVVPDTLPVAPTTPSLRQTMQRIDLDQPIDLAQPAPSPTGPLRGDVVETQQLSMFEVPAEPVVRDVAYTRQPPRGDVVESPTGVESTAQPVRMGKAPDSGVDAAFYDLGTNPTDEAALNAAREALPGYGDENLRAIGRRVQQAYDELDGQDVIPGSIVKKAIQPEAVEGDVVQGFKPRPQEPERVVAHGRMLRGDRAAMEAKGIEGTMFRNKAEYIAMKDRLKSLPTLTNNRANNFENLTPDVVTNRLREQLAMIETGEARITSPKIRAGLQRSLERLESGRITPNQFRKAQRDMVDMDLRIEKQNIIDQLNEVHPSVREAWDLNYDEATGIGRQKSSGLKTLDEVEDALTDEQYNLAKSIEIVANEDGRIRLDVDTEQTGATSRVAEKELSPIGFTRTKDNYVAAVGYNEEGHKVMYYITPKPNELGVTSKINRVISAVNQPAFRGEYANIYKGIREFNIDDIMSRPVRSDGARTSELLQRAAKAEALASRADIMAANPQFAKKLRDFMDNPRAATVKQVEEMEELLKTDPKLLKRLCSILGKAS